MPDVHTEPSQDAMKTAARTPSSSFATVDELCVNTMRTLAIDAIQRANSGHPGLPMGAAPMAYVLWQHHLVHDPADPRWPDRDRFVLSGGHGCMLQYALLHLTGYDVSLDDLKAFRQWGSKTPGHPEAFVTPGVEATTGPLGQGTANAVGMALAERFLAARYNRPGHTIVDHHTYALISDGDLMEGISSEAGSLAGHLGLGKLTYLYDANNISLDGPLSLACSEDVQKRYEAYGWHVALVEHGDTDLAAIDRALRVARSETQKPSLIVVRTTIGYGSPHKAGKAAAHGAPLGVDEVAATKKQLGWAETEAFAVPDEARAHFRQALERGRRAHTDWHSRFGAWQTAHPDLFAEWQLAQAGQLPAGWDRELGALASTRHAAATRETSGLVLQAVAKAVPWLMGGDADLSSSTKSAILGGGNFGAVAADTGADIVGASGAASRSSAGRNVHYGVREHAMGSIANGIAYHGGVRTYASTFFCFVDYMRPSVRLAALNHLPVIYIWTHDSIALGEDGPTHQPVEHLASLRAVPGLCVLRPCDAAETVAAWRFALSEKRRPVALVLTRQSVPVLDRGVLASAEGLQRGAYTLSEAAGGAPRALVLATGSEVHIALAAQAELLAAGIPVRVVSMPSWELFAEQDAAYQESVLPVAVSARVSIEAGVTFGWHKWLGSRGVAIGVDRFGASAPADVLYEKFGLTAANVVAAVRRRL